MCKPTTPHLLAFDEHEDVPFPPVAPPAFSRNGGGVGDDDDNRSRRRRRGVVVHFGTVSVFELGMRPGDHPCCRGGAAVELGDEIVGYANYVSVDEYERVARSKRRMVGTGGASRISFEVRRAIWLQHHRGVVPSHRSFVGNAETRPGARIRSGRSASMKNMVLAPTRGHVEEFRLQYSHVQHCGS